MSKDEEIVFREEQDGRKQYTYYKKKKRRSSSNGSHHSHHGHYSHSNNKSENKKSKLDKIVTNKKVKKFFVKVFKVDSTREISIMLVFMILMALIIPVALLVLDAINNFLLKGAG